MTLREQVEAAVHATLRQRGGWTERDLADAAIGVVLAALAEQIEAMPGYGRGDHGESLPGGHLLPRDAVLAVVRDAGGVA